MTGPAALSETEGKKTIPSAILPDPLAKTKPSLPPSPPLPSNATKSVVFTYRDGRWDGELKLTDSKAYFTERDFNQLSILLNVKRAMFRRKASIALIEARKAESLKAPITKPLEPRKG